MPPRPDDATSTPGEEFSETLLQRLFARHYDRAIAPIEAELEPIRGELLAGLTGSIVEIGAGTGANVPRYPDAADVTLIEPFPTMRSQLEDTVAARAAGSRFTVVEGCAENLPLPDASADVVVSTLVLCSVQDVETALSEIDRVLEPGGVFVFLEHQGGSGLRRAVQNVLTPLWHRVAGNCHLNRDLAASIEARFGAAQWRDVMSDSPISRLPAGPFVAGRACKAT